MNKKTIVFLIAFLIIFGYYSEIISAKDIKIPKKALKLEKKGNKAMSKGKYDKAMEFFNKALEIYPDIETVHYKIASIYAYKKNYKDAISELNLTLKINPAHVNAKKAIIDTTLKYGNLLLKNKKIDEANKLFIDLQKINGIKEIDGKLITELDYRIGFNYFQLRKGDESNLYLLKFINNPESIKLFRNFFSTANYLIGLNFSQKGEIKNSNKYLKNFVALNSETPDNKYLGFAKYIIGMNSFNALKEKIGKIEKIKTRKNLKQSNRKILELAKSENDIEENILFAIKKKPELENAYVILGNFYYLRRDLENAIKYYKLLLEKFPNSTDTEIYKVFLSDIERQKKQKSN